MDDCEDKKTPAQLLREEMENIQNERIAAESEQQPRQPPAIKTEYQKFVKETGGPIEIDGFPKVPSFRSCCWEFPLRSFLPMIERWQTCEATGRRHWPAMAFVTSGYRFLQREFLKNGKEPSAKDISELLSTIAASAKQLRSSLAILQKLALQPSDGSAPLARPQLQWIDQLIAQAEAGMVLQDVDKSPEVMAAVYLQRDDFVERVICVEAAATSARNRLDENLLKRPRGPENRALRTLVTRAKPIWKSLTGREPSVNKVYTKETEEPDFVRFVQCLADIAGGPRPSFKQVQTAFRPARPPN
jgi:hypothetical protein